MQFTQFLKTLSLAGLFVVSGWSADAAEIELRSDAAVSGSLVRLGDIAHVQHEQAEVAQAWEAIALFPAPAAGKTRLLKRQELAGLLAFNAEELTACQIVGAAAVNIRVGGATDVVAVGKSDGLDEARLRLTGARPRNAQASQNRLQQAAHAEPEATASKIPTTVAPASPEYLAVVAVRRLDRGQRIRADDVALRPVPADTAEGALIQAVPNVVGREATQLIRADQPIAPDMIQASRLVKRGENVTVRSIAAGITISTTGRALEEGSEGALVQVELADSHERIAARVTGLQQVEIYANGPRLSPPTPTAAATLAAPPVPSFTGLQPAAQ